MIIKTVKYLKGYLKVEIKGFSTERFMNLAANKDIYMWDIFYKNNKIEFKVSIDGYKLLKQCGRKTKCKIKILEKKGYPFFIFKYRKRKILLGGIVFFTLSIYLLSNFIWKIEIKGNERIRSYEIIDYLKENNIGVGTLKWKIDTSYIEEDLLNVFTDLSWINIQKKGSMLKIACSEILVDKEIEETKAPSNIVANKNGVITEISVTGGTALVKKGDVFKKGDILISGAVLIREDEGGEKFRYVFAQGNIRGKVTYKINFEVAKEYVAAEFTGKEKMDYDIIYKDKLFKLHIRKKIFKNYDIVSTNKQIKLTEDLYTPIVLRKNIYKEIKLVNRSRTEEEAKEFANKLINSKLIEELAVTTDIESVNIDFTNTSESVIVDVFITTIEELGTIQLINDIEDNS